MRNAVLLSAMLVGVVMPAAADQAAKNPQTNARLGALRSAQPRNPYEKLFQARENELAVGQPAAKAAPKTRIVCGMTVIEADPSLDPKMMITPPGDDQTRDTIRAIEPTICK